MSDNNDEKKVSFWHTMPGCITAIGGLVSVVVAAVVALSAAGFIKPPFPATEIPPVVAIEPNSIPAEENIPSVPNTEPAIQLPPTPVPPTNTAMPIIQPIVIEFDDQTQGVSRAAVCDHQRQDMSPFGTQFWREGDQLFGAGSDCGLSFNFTVKETNYYKLTLYATYAPDFGILRLTIVRGAASDEVSKIDLYGRSVTHSGPIDLGNWLLTEDEGNRFIVWVEGKNAVSSDFKFGLDYLQLECLNQIRNGSC